jgi:hypothetical protein
MTMKTNTRSLLWRIFHLLAPCLLAASVVTADPWRTPYNATGGIGGTGIQSDDRGIGGTGVDNGIGGTGGPVYKDDRGIGGTGIDGGIDGTGIIGTITRFGSIIVNGARVAFDSTLPVESLDGATTPQDFRIGHVVALETIERNGVLYARNARIRFPVAGLVTNIDTRQNRISVLDRWVQMSPDVLINDDINPDLPPILGIGDYVQVSGLTRPDGIIDASRVERRPAGRTRIVGTVTSTNAEGFKIERRQFNWPNGRVNLNVTPGSRVVVTGRYRQGQMIATRMRVRPSVPFGGRYRRLLVEGFAQPDPQGVRVRGLAVNPRAIQSQTTIINRRIIVGGVVERGNHLRATTFRLPRLRELRRYDRKQRRIEKQKRQDRRDRRSERQQRRIEKQQLQERLDRRAEKKQRRIENQKHRTKKKPGNRRRLEKHDTKFQDTETPADIRQKQKKQRRKLNQTRKRKKKAQRKAKRLEVLRKRWQEQQ